MSAAPSAAASAPRAKREAATGESPFEQFVQARLGNRGCACAQGGDGWFIEIQSDDGEMFRATRRRHAAQVPQAEDDDVHGESVLSVPLISGPSEK